MIEGLKVHYEVKGEGPDLLILHGWGTGLESFRPVIEDLSAHFKVWAIDFPGCGQTPEPDQVWSVEDYGDFVLRFIRDRNIKEPIVFGHSHGGRVAIQLGSRMGCDFKKIVLIDSAGIPPERKNNYYYRVYAFKAAKFLAMLPVFKWLLSEFLEEYRLKYGSADYKIATPKMRAILSKVVNEDLRPLLPDVNVPTLLVWGGKDTATPVSDAKVMEELLPHVGLVVFDHAGHYSYLDNLPGFLAVVKNFLEREMVN